jgi:hypothetical protein
MFRAVSSIYDLGSYRKLGSEKDTVAGLGGSKTWRQDSMDRYSDFCHNAANTGNSHLMKNFADHNCITVAKVSMRFIMVMS